MVLVRQVFRFTATTAICLAIVSCAPRPRVVYATPPYPVVYAPSSPVLRAYRPPPARYMHARSPVPYPPGRGVRYGKSTPPQAGSQAVWHSSPRSAAVKKKTRTSGAKLDPSAKFKAAQAKAAKVGVENLKKEDIDGLTSAQITELRGY
jgi:hypothetical protein